jgi:hypothetical protein
MSVVPPENTNRLEHKLEQAAELHHDKEMMEHHENLNSFDEKQANKEELVAGSGDSQPPSETPDYQTKTV